MSDYLTEKLPGTGGTIKESPEDFFVEEIPLYEPCGEGEHLYVEVEKQGITTFSLLHQMARALKIKEGELGYAGLKDARATTRQIISIPGITPGQINALEMPGVKILSCRYHRNKLRPGHLAGNRFLIKIRGIGDNGLEKALDILYVLQNVGVPNRFGEQRYGAMGNSHRIGRALLKEDFDNAARMIVGDPQSIRNERWRQGAKLFSEGELEKALQVLPERFRDERKLIRNLLNGKSPKQAVLNLPRKLLRIYMSAYQSYLFDRMVTMRLDTLDTLWEGDLAFKHENGACFIVKDPAAEQPRVENFEISPSGPLFGYKVKLAQGQAGILEKSLLESEGTTQENFRLGNGLSMEGERRPLRVPIKEVKAHQQGEDLILAFVLPKGSYATSVLREVMKTESAPT